MEADARQAELVLYAIELSQTRFSVSRLDDADRRGEPIRPGIAVARDRVVLGAGVGDSVRALVAVAGNDDGTLDLGLVHDAQSIFDFAEAVRLGLGVQRTGQIAAEGAECVPHVVVHVEDFESPRRGRHLVSPASRSAQRDARRIPARVLHVPERSERACLGIFENNASLDLDMPLSREIVRQSAGRIVLLRGRTGNVGAALLAQRRAPGTPPCPQMELIAAPR